MLLGKKSLFSFLTTTPTIGSVFYFSKSKNPTRFLDPNLFPKNLELTEKISDFLKIGNTEKDLKDLVKDYLKTLTGAKDLANILVSNLIVDFIDIWKNTDTSALKDKLQGSLSNLRNLNSIDTLGEGSREEALKPFAADDSFYKNFNTSRKIKKEFIDGIIENLDNAIESKTESNKITYSLKYDKSPDEVIKTLHPFFNSLFDDYIRYEKPVPVKKITWKYDNSNKSKEIKEFFDDKLPTHHNIPSNPSYFFPFFSDETNAKFKSFVDKLKDNNGGSSGSNGIDYESVSDVKETDILITSSTALDSSNTSQFIIAALELQNHVLTVSGWNDTVLNSHFKFPKKISTDAAEEQTKTICQDENNMFPTFAVEKFKDEKDEMKKLEKIFCIDKNHLPFTKQKQYTDFFYLKPKKNGSPKFPSNWIVFKDKNGVHAMGVNKDLEDAISWPKSQNFLIKSYKENKNFKFELKQRLRDHLDKHFERIILKNWYTFYNKAKNGTNGSTDENKWKDLIEKLKDLLNNEIYSNDFITLRSNFIKDYVDLLKGSPEKENPELGFAGKFPYLPYLKDEIFSSVSNLPRGLESFSDFLERTYFADRFKNTKLYTHLSKQFKDIFKNYTSQIDTFFTSNNSSITKETKSEENENYFIFKKSTDNKNPKSLSIDNILNLVWLSMLQTNHATQILIQDQLKDKLKFYEWKDDTKEWKSSKVDIDNNTKKELFNGDNGDELWKVIIKNYLYLLHKNKFISSVNPKVYKNFKYEEFSNTDKFINILKDLDKNDRFNFTGKGLDLLSKDTQDLFAELVTINYLAKNKFENFRKVLRNRLSRDTFSAFIFSRKFSNNDICKPEAKGFSKDDEKDFKFDAKRNWQLNNKYLGFNESNEFKKTECINREELFNFASTKLPKEDGSPDSTSKVLTGYKGLYSSDITQILPEEIVNQLNKKIVPWKDLEDLKKYVEAIKSEHDFEALIKQLWDIFPNINWNIAEHKYLLLPSNLNFNWKNAVADRLINQSSYKLTLIQRKKILKAFLAQETTNLFDKNASWEHLGSIQKNLLNNSDDQKQLIKSDKFKGYYDWFKNDDGSYLLTDPKTSDQYLFFLVQIKYSDVVNETNWTNYLKTISSDLIIRELVYAAKKKDIQQKAIYYAIHEESNDSDKLKKFKTGDDRLRRAFDYQWRGGLLDKDVVS